MDIELKNITVSVIVPIYKAEKTLENCLYSIFNQTYPQYEIVLVDDGSNDNSAIVCDAECLANPNIIVVHKQNAGPSSARNIGIELVSGKYFVCVDSDDIVKNSYLEDFIELKTRHPELGHIWCGFERTSENGKQYVCENTAESFKDRSNYQELSEKVLAQSPCFHLFKTAIVRQYCLKMREDLSLGEDVIFNLEYLDAVKNTKIGIINKPNYVYLDTDDASLNNKYRSDLATIYDSLDSIIEKYLNKWEILDKSSFYNGVLSHYFHVFSNTFHIKNQAGIPERIKFNSAVMKTQGFRTALNNATCYLNPALKKAYLSGNYWMVLLVQQLAQIKNRVVR